MPKSRCLLLLVVVGLTLGALVNCDLAPTPTPFLPSPVRPTPRPPASPTPEPGPWPKVLAQIPLAPPDGSLLDLLLDRDANHLYVTDSAGWLHVLDVATYTELTTLPVAGKAPLDALNRLGYAGLTLDAANHRLYVATSAAQWGSVIAVDTRTLTVVGTVTPGGWVAVDSAHQRLYVGDSESVRVYDGNTLAKLGEIPQPGRPAYNPGRDELYIANLTVYRVDPQTRQITDDLLPDVSAQPCLACPGSLWASRVLVYPERNLLIVELVVAVAGKGIISRSWRGFDATTLAPLPDSAPAPALAPACGESAALIEAVDGYLYREQHTTYYTTSNTLFVYDQAGNLVTQREGLRAGITNPNTGQMYIPANGYLLVLDLATLTPVGTVPVDCLHTLDTTSGTLYAFSGRDLVVLAERGGAPASLPPVTCEALAAAYRARIEVSPNYAADRMLFVRTLGNEGGRLYRSRDGGQTWVELLSGLWVRGYMMDLVLSPEFATDHTLFAYGSSREDAFGTGVYRSTDGGDTWQAMWQGLLHLHVYDVALSPDYATDGTLLAYSNYNHHVPGEWTPTEWGSSIFRSTDRGLNWSLVMTTTETLPPPESLWPADPSLPRLPPIQFRADGGVERTTDGGRTWQSVAVTHQPDFRVVAVLPSPNRAADHTVYVVSAKDLFRSIDDGDTWQHWRDARLEGRDANWELTAAALSPLLDDGRYQLFIVTTAGEFWVLDPPTLAWEPVE